MRTGARIILDSLFTSEGSKILLDSLNEIKKRTLNLKLLEIKNSLALPGIREDKEQKDYYTDMEALYTECFERKIEMMEYLQFYVTRTELFIESDRCSAHVNRSLDEIDNFKFTFDLKNWDSYFTPYAFNLLRK
jgi:hypothetical protein